MPKCILCKRQFSESHRVETDENGEKIYFEQTMCIACDGIFRLNKYRHRRGIRQALPEPILDTENRKPRFRRAFKPKTVTL